MSKCLWITLALLWLTACARQSSVSNEGNKISARPILNGTTPGAGLFPSVGILTWVLPNGQQFICTGSLVAPKTVVTAAHCVSEFDSRLGVVDNPPSEYHFTLLTTLPSNLNGPSVYAVSKIFRHPKYLPIEIGSTLGQNIATGADVAVLQLSREITNVPFAPIWRGSNSLVSAAGSGIAVGYGRSGRDSSGGVAQDGNGTAGTKLFAQLPFNSFLDSLTLESFAPQATAPLVNGLIRFDRNSQNQTICPGDSGGPMLVDVLGKKQIVGMLSTGRFSGGKCVTGVDGNYTTSNNAPVADWLETTFAQIELPIGACGTPNSDFANKSGGCQLRTSRQAWSSKADRDLSQGQARNYCSQLVEGTYGDWRLPTRTELLSLAQADGAKHLNVLRRSKYWATESDNNPARGIAVSLLEEREHSVVADTRASVICVRN